jgi:transposase
MALVLTAGQRHEQSAFEALMEQGAVKRGGHGRPKLRPKCVVADKGYNSVKIRGYLRRRGFGVVIPRQNHERRRGPFDKQRHQQRNRVERLINSLKRFRRVATRYEKLSDNYLAMVTIAAITIWL